MTDKEIREWKVSDHIEEPCRYCGNPVMSGTEAKTHGYWTPIPFICHRGCKEQGFKQEAFDCQCIDADCNDCKNFARGKLVESGVHAGTCTKTGLPTFAFPNKWTGHPCFEHRRKQT